MEWKKFGAWILRASLALYLLVLTSLIPPAIHMFMHYCPVRPDGVQQASAVPAFSRKYNVSCSMCHSAFPVLNDVGRKFKENGYVLDRAGENAANGDKMMLPSSVPWAFVVKGEPFGKQRTQKPEIRAINDIGMFVSDGSVAKNFSYWLEAHMRSADGAANPQGFGFTFERARVGWHYDQYLNILGGFGSVTEGVDTYETLSSPVHSIVGNRVTDLLDHAKTPAGQFDPPAFDQQYLALQGSLEKENVGALKYWTAVGAGWGAPTAQGGNGNGVDAPVGQGPMNGNFRLVLDTLKGFALGGYYQFGHNDWNLGTTVTGLAPGANTTAASAQADFVNTVQSYAVDGLAEFKGLTARAAFIDQRMKNASSGVNFSNRKGHYIEAFYAIDKNKAPWLTPMLRYESLTDNTAGSKRSEKDYVVSALSWFPYENVRAVVEYWDNTKNRTNGKNGFCDNKFSTSFNIGF
jgi:hypothetical protein